MFGWYKKYQNANRALKEERKLRASAEKLLLERTSEFSKTQKLYQDMVAKEEERASDKEHLLSIAEKKLDALVNSVSDIIFRANPAGEFVYVNDSVSRIIGFEVDEVIGKHFTELVHPHHTENVVQFYYEQVMKREKSTYLEFPCLTKSGDFIWVGQKVTAVYNDQGDLLEMNAVVRDIDDRKKEEERSNILFQRMETMMGNLNSAILIEDENRNIALTNQLFCDLFQIPAPPEALIGMDCSNSAEQSKHLFKNPENFISRIDTILREKKKVIDEKVEMADGRILLREYLPVYIDDHYKGHLWAYRDITEKELYDRRLQASEEKYRGIIENMELGLMEVNNDQVITKVYDRFCEMTGYEPDELIGKNAVDVFLPEAYKNINVENHLKRAQGNSSVYEIEMRKKDGSTFWAMISGAPIRDINGETTGSIGIHYDISEQKKAQQELIEARNAAERSRMVEKEFLAKMSHEIRNPINAIIGASSLMYDTFLSADQKEHLETISYSSEILLNLIKDVLDINKIDSGEMLFKEEQVSLPSLINSIIRTHQFKAANKNVEIIQVIDPEVRYDVLTDKTYVNQILLNLLGNAIKFTEDGYIKIFLKEVEAKGSKRKLRLTVEDTGIGIAPDQVESIFEKFRQADYDIKLKYGGTGLGLAITRQLVDRMGGEIWVESELNKGSSFICEFEFETLKRKNSPSPVRKQPKISSLEKISRILVVEDNLLNQKYLKGILKKQNLTFDMANNGLEALNLIDKHTYDVILMDIRMPEMDGYQTTIAIRGMDDNPNKDAIIIALTASALVDEKEKAVEAGMNDHLSKPYTVDELFDVIAGHLEQDGPSLKEHNVAEDSVFRFNENLDINTLQMYYADDLDYALQMFEVFQEVYPDELERLEKNYDQQNWTEFFKGIHKLKSNFTMVGLPALTQLFEDIEKFKKDEGANEVSDLYEHFREEQSRIIPIVDEQIEALRRHLNTAKI